MRALARRLYLDILGSFVKPKSGVHILNGHFLSRNTDGGVKRFESLLRELRQFSEFLNVEDAVRLVESGECRKFGGVGLAFTFDDGFLDCYQGLAPALHRYGVNACFFVNPGFVDGSDEYRRNFTERVVFTPGKKSMTWMQIADLHKQGFLIGNHTVDHCRLSLLGKVEIEKQILDGKARIEAKLDSKVEYFAWPYGQESDFNLTALEVAKSAHRYIFSGFGYREYFSFGGAVINRRHFEADWNLSHVKYFLSKEKSYVK